jgi:hypothetical protein
LGGSSLLDPTRTCFLVGLAIISGQSEKASKKVSRFLVVAGARFPLVLACREKAIVVPESPRMMRKRRLLL